MPGCFVPLCQSGYVKKRNENKRLGQRNESLFNAPKDEEMLEKWRKAIPRGDKILTSIEKVCEKHFTEDDIERFYETTLIDGTLFRLEKGRTALKPDAVPSIFPGLPKYLTKVTKKRKPPPIRHVVTGTPIKIKEEYPVIFDVSEMLEEEIFTFESLKDEANELMRADSSWIANCLDKAIVWVKWDQDLNAERRLIVTEDLTVKIFLKGMQIDLLPQIYSVDCVEFLLRRVNDMIICPGIDRQSPGCIGFKENGLPNSLEDYIIVCRNCYNNKDLPCAAAERKKSLLEKREEKRTTLAQNTMRKNLVLQRRVKDLKEKLKALRKEYAVAMSVL